MKTHFDNERVWRTFERNLDIAEQRLASIPVCRGRRSRVQGISGWVFEQTIQHCILSELRRKGVRPEFEEQFAFGSRARADLRVGNVLLEIKLSGFFGAAGCKKYAAYRRALVKGGFSYLFVTGEESHEPYRRLAKRVFGRGNTFFLDTPCAWERFIARLTRILTR